MTVLVSPWWQGLSVDHLYEHCPARLRSVPSLRRSGWPEQGRGELDPEGGDVCRWCIRVWRARNRARDARKAAQKPAGGTNRPALVSGELHGCDSSAQSALPTCTQTPGGNQ